jgi:hypothetical protein
MYAAPSSSSDIALLTLSWINEQLRLEAARRQAETEWCDEATSSLRRQWLMALAGTLCGLGVLIVRLYA